VVSTLTSSFDEVVNIVNRWELAPNDGKSSKRPPNVDSFGGINWKCSGNSQSDRITLVLSQILTTLMVLEPWEEKSSSKVKDEVTNGGVISTNISFI